MQTRPYKSKFVLDIIQDTRIFGCIAAKFPFHKGVKLSINHGQIMEDPKVYIRLIDRLLYPNLTIRYLLFCVITQSIHELS